VLQVPCGSCVGCLLERSRQWAVRCLHESQLHSVSSFITLTYDDDHLRQLSLDYSDFQLFLRRLRRAKGAVRFFMCGEYGDELGRPHFHACLFGVDFPDRQLFKELPSGSKLYVSPELSALWPQGFSSVGDVTFESAAYVARYVLKKKARGGEPVFLVDGSTGECVEREPEFTQMSLKPGIGARWYEQFKAEVFPRDRVVMNGAEMKPPRYYLTLLERADPVSREFIRQARSEVAERNQGENHPDRLRVREVCAKARLSFKKRSLA